MLWIKSWYRFFVIYFLSYLNKLYEIIFESYIIALFENYFLREKCKRKLFNFFKLINEDERIVLMNKKFFLYY